ncbi:MAG: glycosyltransferase family 4 protein [Bacteroidetes bacterium]|nr:glycosyltransferase family 4 protein [Bacteroidota bacterium]MBS1649789.1 glycosyltransferase family 4 protein [Bacteroidota bacterium]
MKKNILIISTEFPPAVGGIGNHAFHLANSFQHKNYNTTVVADVNEPDEQKIISFQQNISFAFIPIQRKKNILFVYLKRIKQTIHFAKQADIIFCSGKFSVWQIHIIKLFYSSKPIISIVHGTELDLKNNFGKTLLLGALKKSNAIIAVSNYTKSFVPKNLQEKCFVIPNGINNEEFKNYISTTSQTNPLQLITIGSVTNRKGQENVIKALPTILSSFPETVYHIVGKPVEKEKLLAVANKLNVANKIIFHGAVERTELLKILQAATIKIMLSNHTSDGDFEGFGIAILEGNAAGKPAVGANFGGITDAIKDNFNGILVDVNNANNITNAIKEILNDYKNYSNHALQWAQQHDWNNIIEQYIEMINC